MNYDKEREEQRADEAFITESLKVFISTDSGRLKLCSLIIETLDEVDRNPHRSRWVVNEMRKLFLRIMPYKKYLQTKHWKVVAARARQRAEHRCQLCNSPDNLEVHHRTYERRGHESESDLTVLCDTCHGKFHCEEEPE